MSRAATIPGIIGGAGPRTTTQLYLDIVARCQDARLVHRPAILIASLDIDLVTEEHLLTTGDGVREYWPGLLDAARRLTAAGAGFLAMPCNTLHVLINQLRSEIPIPMTSILDCVVSSIRTQGFRKVGLLATEATVASGLYQDSLRAAGIEVVKLMADHQCELQRRILAEVTAYADQVNKEFLAAVANDCGPGIRCGYSRLHGAQSSAARMGAPLANCGQPRHSRSCDRRPNAQLSCFVSEAREPS